MRDPRLRQAWQARASLQSPDRKEQEFASDPPRANAKSATSFAAATLGSATRIAAARTSREARADLDIELRTRTGWRRIIGIGFARLAWRPMHRLFRFRVRSHTFAVPVVDRTGRTAANIVDENFAARTSCCRRRTVSFRVALSATGAVGRLRRRAAASAADLVVAGGAACSVRSTRRAEGAAGGHRTTIRTLATRIDKEALAVEASARAYGTVHRDRRRTIAVAVALRAAGAAG